MGYKIISGGQTGADLAGLKAAKEIGIKTGGIAPKTYRTELGPNLALKSIYELDEDSDFSYTPRTLKNVKNSDCTIIIYHNRNSPGTNLTRKYCREQNKPFLNIDIENPHNPFQITQWIKKYNYRTINIAGNRENSEIKFEERVFEYLKLVFSELVKE